MADWYDDIEPDEYGNRILDFEPDDDLPSPFDDDYGYNGGPLDLPEPGSIMDTYGVAYNRESYFRQ
jgi:hypothetical protein